jgi:predicted transcriptional regulator YdeE
MPRSVEEKPVPVFREAGEVVLAGTMAVYGSQAEVNERVPHQWREFLLRNPSLGVDSRFYGASPCTPDRKIHYLTGVALGAQEDLVYGERLTLVAGEYAVVLVDDPDRLRDTWVWLLEKWLPSSGRREKSAPEFERYTEISKTGSPIGPVEIWIPLEPVEKG